MSDIAALKALVKRAYDAGCTDVDPFCTPDDHASFEDFWASLGGGDLASALAAMIDTAADSTPSLIPGGVIRFKEDDFVLVGMQRARSRTTVELQDRRSYEEDNRLDPNDIAQAATEFFPNAPQGQQGTFSTPLMPTGHASPPRGGAMLPVPEPLQCTIMYCTLQGGHKGEHVSRYLHPNTGKTTCHCDGPPHVHSPGWCPEQPVVDGRFKKP